MGPGAVTGPLEGAPLGKRPLQGARGLVTSSPQLDLPRLAASPQLPSAGSTSHSWGLGTVLWTLTKLGGPHHHAADARPHHAFSQNSASLAGEKYQLPDSGQAQGCAWGSL